MSCVFMKITDPSSGSTMLASTYGVSGPSGWWDRCIVGIPSLSYAYPDSGGFIKVSRGSFRIANQGLYAGGLWPPPDVVHVDVMWSRQAKEETAILLGRTKAFLDTVYREVTAYNLWDSIFDDITALQQGVDVDGNPVDIPMLVGSVDHFVPVRTGVTTEHRYYKSGVSGSVGVDWHVYDDGVNIDSNVSDDADTFFLSAAPVGTVTVSGTGSITTLVGLFQWAASELSVSLDSLFATDRPINKFVSSQSVLLDMLDNVAGYTNHVFWFSYDYATMYLNDRSVYREVKEFSDFDFFRAPFSANGPIKEIKADLTYNKPVDDSAGRRIETDTLKVVVPGAHGVGDEISIDPWDTTEADIKQSISVLLSSWSEKKINVSMPIPATDIGMMTEVQITDSSLPAAVNLNMRIMRKSFNFEKGKIEVSGSGAVT